MTRLYVGCRVRIVRAIKVLDANGREGVIVGVSEKDRFDWLVSIPGFRSWIPAGWWHVRSDCLEPILPDGHQVVEWSECLWQPDGITEPSP